MSTRAAPRRSLFPSALVVAALAAGVAGAAGTSAACASGDLLVGDDARDAATRLSEAGTSPPPPNAKDSSTSDAPTGDAATTDAAGDGAAPGCAASPPPPPLGVCDGGQFAPLYDAMGCVVGFACTPVSCTSAGGTCVGLSPGSCMGNSFGDGTIYSCGGGVGLACCIP